MIKVQTHSRKLISRQLVYSERFAKLVKLIKKPIFEIDSETEKQI